MSIKYSGPGVYLALKTTTAANIEGIIHHESGDPRTNIFTDLIEQQHRIKKTFAGHKPREWERRIAGPYEALNRAPFYPFIYFCVHPEHTKDPVTVPSDTILLAGPYENIERASEASDDTWENYLSSIGVS